MKTITSSPTIDTLLVLGNVDPGLTYFINLLIGGLPFKHHITTGWWFGTFFFFHILGIVTPTDELIFFRGVAQPPTRLLLTIINHHHNHYIILTININIVYETNLAGRLKPPTSYPLVNIQKAIENGPVEIVDFPIRNGDFP